MYSHGNHNIICGTCRAKIKVKHAILDTNKVWQCEKCYDKPSTPKERVITERERNLRHQDISLEPTDAFTVIPDPYNGVGVWNKIASNWEEIADNWEDIGGSELFPEDYLD